MCRWLAYTGGPIALSELVFDTEHSIIDQSLASHSSVQTTNGDGFGIGWFDEVSTPGMYKSTRPAWNDPNLRDLCTHTQSKMFLAHIRAATGTAIQYSNCHPFRSGNWLFVHNGSIRGAKRLRRQLMLEISEELFPEIAGTTDSELMFYLALHFGMDDDPYTGVSRMVGFVEALGHQSGIEHPMQMTLGIADGERFYACRYSSERKSRTLYLSKDIAAIRDLVPQDRRSRLDRVTDDARTIVSEPFSDLPEMWQEIPESTFITISAGEVETRPFEPTPP
jgi:predicted glutamine amidotransferase